VEFLEKFGVYPLITVDGSSVQLCYSLKEGLFLKIPFFYRRPLDNFLKILMLQKTRKIQQICLERFHLVIDIHRMFTFGHDECRHSTMRESQVDIIRDDDDVEQK